jgi:hypothetical protein
MRAYQHDGVLLGGIVRHLAVEGGRPESGDALGVGAVDGEAGNVAAHEELLE